MPQAAAANGLALYSVMPSRRLHQTVVTLMVWTTPAPASGSSLRERPADSPTAIPALLAAATIVGSASMSHAQVELKTYADAKGYIVIRNLTCAQLAGTFQEDADFLGVWFSGWYNGRNKKHMINVDRTKKGIHQVIVYCI
jgi:HdeA/HdeB family